MPSPSQSATMLAPEAKLGSAPAHPLHVVIFLVDDLGYGDTHHMGAEYDTPHISSLALGGVRLNQSYAAMLCSPSRASLLSSRYAYRVGMDGEVLNFGDERCLNVTTLGKQMKRFGMHTAFIGKHDVGFFSTMGDMVGDVIDRVEDMVGDVAEGIT